MLRVALAVLLVACASRREPQTTTETASDTTSMAQVPLMPPVVDLTGAWRTGTGAEPQVDSIVLYPTCLVIPAAWVIDQERNVVTAWEFPERYNQGILSRNSEMRRIPARGTISGSDVVLDDGTHRYALRYDTASRHLRGTRSGVPFWAVRQIVVRTQHCPPPP